MRRIDRTLDYDQITVGDDLRLEFQGEPFTGEVVETIGGELLSQVFYVDGIQHGPDREWWGDGPLKAEGEVRHGMAVGTFREWHHNGQLACEKEFDGSGDLVSVTKWDEAGNRITR